MNDLYGMKIADRNSEFIHCEVKAVLNQGRIKRYIASQSADDEYKEIDDYLSSHRIDVFPYNFKSDYKTGYLEAYKDESCGMIYIPYKNMKVYMRKMYTSFFRAKFYFKNIRMEQDVRSPHRYTTDSFRPRENSVNIDIGGAEGFFSLDYVDKAKAVYIFECDPDWNEALLKTYQDYSDKIHIVNKFVSDRDDEHNVKLDTFVKENGIADDELFIKIDAEGSEPYILDGARQLLDSSSRVKLAVCSYHCADHEQVIRSKFDDSWKITPSHGYMLYYYDYNFYDEPYVRRGVLRIEKA